MFPWFALMPRWAKDGLVILLVTAAIAAAGYGFMKAVANFWESGRDAGVTAERAKSQEIIIQNVEKAHAISNQVEQEAAAGRGVELHRQCLRSARTPENCQRYLPD